MLRWSRRKEYIGLALAVVLFAGCSGSGGSGGASGPVTGNCGALNNGSSETRVRYATPTVLAPATCVSETQQRVCTDGALSAWSGSYNYAGCTVVSNDPYKLPLWTINQLEYLGGFRLSAAQYGASENSTLSYSPGAIAYNPKRHSLYVVGHAYEQGLAEFAIPAIVNSRDMKDFNVGSTVLQQFVPFYNTGRVDTGISSYFLVTGMALIEGQLAINYINWYDAGGTETDTTVRLHEPDNLAASLFSGPFQLQGAAHAAGWISDIPAEWQSDLGGTHLSGHAHGSIRSRLSVGPSAFVWSPANSLLTAGNGSIATNAALDFPLNNNHILYNRTAYGTGPINVGDILANTDRRNDLWTAVSGAAFGFIIPGTNSYLTLGFSGGNDSGVGYKITQDNGNLCGGYCTYAAADNYNYFWLWRVTDLVKVRKGEMAAYDVRPYSYGILDTPSKALLKGGAYDASTKLLYIALQSGDTVGTYSRPPLFLVYKVNVE